MQNRFAGYNYIIVIERKFMKNMFLIILAGLFLYLCPVLCVGEPLIFEYEADSMGVGYFFEIASTKDMGGAKGINEIVREIGVTVDYALIDDLLLSGALVYHIWDAQDEYENMLDVLGEDAYINRLDINVSLLKTFWFNAEGLKSVLGFCVTVPTNQFNNTSFGLPLRFAGDASLVYDVNLFLLEGGVTVKFGGEPEGFDWDKKSVFGFNVYAGIKASPSISIGLYYEQLQQRYNGMNDKSLIGVKLVSNIDKVILLRLSYLVDNNNDSPDRSISVSFEYKF